MTMMVLQDKAQITRARKELKSKGASAMDWWLPQRLKKLGLIPGVALGDMCKSWDLLLTLKFIERNLKKDEPILDIGCYASEAVAALHKLAYTNLTGIDLNPNLKKMPYQGSIRYETGNFMHTQFEDASFRAITAVSVIEHGFNGPALLKEMSRILKPGGYFIASFDYWPEKIDTAEIKIFDMDWKIFSKQEVANVLIDAEKYGMYANGTMAYLSKEHTIDCAGKKYTFGWLVLKKKD